jgi:hypothetical protein
LDFAGKEIEMKPYWTKRPETMQEMRRLGVFTDVTDAELIDSRPSGKVRIEAPGGNLETCIFDLGPVGTGFMAWMTLTVVDGPFAIAEFSLTPPWPGTQITWLSDPALGTDPTYIYRFPGRRADQFARETVINRHADAQKMLRRGVRIEGFLLGFSSEPIPHDYKHGQHVLGNIGVFDQFDVPYSVEADFWIDRTARLAAANRVTTPRKSLFGERVLRGE